MRKFFQKGSVIFREGDYGDCAYAIEKGVVAISTSRGAKELLLANRSVGEIFGEMAIVDDKPRSASAVASDDCVVLVISRDQLQNRVAMLDPVMRMVLNVILERFRDSVRRMSEEASISEPGRKPTQQVENTAKPPVDDYLSAIERIELEQAIKQALTRDEFELFYQPIVCASRGTIVGFEGLARWWHPTRGLLSPTAFIPVAEESGLIFKLSRWAIQRACEDVRAMRSIGDHTRSLFVSVNVTGDDICEGGIIEDVQNIFSETQTLQHTIEFEVTESTLVSDPERAIEIFEKLQALGISIAIDDFGTGYSNLRYLARYPAQKLKIDKCFVDSLVRDEQSEELVRAIIQLSHSAGMSVVAEGVERMDQATLLAELNCDMLQGYLFAKPMPLEMCLQYLNEETRSQAKLGYKIA